MNNFNTRTNATQERESAKYYLNLYAAGKRLGYIVLDDHPKIVEFLKNNPDDGVARMIAKMDGVFREAGVNSEPDLSDW